MNHVTKGRSAEMALILVAGFLLLWAVGDRGLWAAEGRWAEINREMFLTGDFFHPAINGEPYFDKPLLTYWLISLTALISGSLNEWTVRFPGALAGIFAVWATARLGRRLFSERVGLIAGWLLLAGYGFLFWSRTATAESENLLAVILCLAWYRARRDRPGFTSFFIFWLIAFLGALTKGLTAVVVPVLAVLPDLLRRSRWKAIFRPAQVLALILAVLIYLAPFVYASFSRPDYGENGLTLVFRENILRYFRPFDHKGPIYTYIYQIPLLFLPWSPLFLAALAGSLINWRKLDQGTRWVIRAVGLIFIFFSLSGSRRSYYILPVLPLVALWTANFFAGIKDNRMEKYQRWGMNIQLIISGLLAFAAAAAPAAWPLIRGRVGFIPPPGLLLAVLIPGLAALILILAALRSPVGARRRLSALIASTVILLGGYFCVILPTLDIYRTERAFAQALRGKTDRLAPEAIAFYPDLRSNMVFYLEKERPVRVFKKDQLDELGDFLSTTPSGVIIAQRRYREIILPLFPPETVQTDTIAETVHPWEAGKVPRRRIAWFFKL